MFATSEWTFVSTTPPPTPVSPRKQEMKQQKEPKKPVIKKPLNAFMLYMKEMRAKVIAECTLKESAAINQILGRRVRDGTHTHTLKKNDTHKLSLQAAETRTSLRDDAQPSSPQFSRLSFTLVQK